MTRQKNSNGISRRNLLHLGGATVLTIGLGMQLITSNPAIAGEVPDLNGDQALRKLKEGNQRYVSFKRSYPDQDAMRLKTVAKGQHPFAVILGCADSRVPPELLFDQGLGDLFVIRVAGNILNDATLASIEFATAELGVPLVMVLGHQRCGAVNAALDGGEVPGHIGRLMEAIKPALVGIQDQKGDKLDNAIRANVKMVVKQVTASTPILSDLVTKGKLKVVGGHYGLENGVVEMIA